jgi:hypothetical protein
VALVTLDKALKVPAVPGKVPTIMASGKPFVAAVPKGNDTRQVAAQSGGGLAVNAVNPVELADALDMLYRDSNLRSNGVSASLRLPQYLVEDGGVWPSSWGLRRAT